MATRIHAAFSNQKNYLSTEMSQLLFHFKSFSCPSFISNKIWSQFWKYFLNFYSMYVYSWYMPGSASSYCWCMKKFVPTACCMSMGRTVFSCLVLGNIVAKNKNNLKTIVLILLILSLISHFFLFSSNLFAVRQNYNQLESHKHSYRSCVSN